MLSFLPGGPMDNEQRTWSASVIKGICIVKYNSKNVSCEELCIYIGGCSWPDMNWIPWKIGLCLELTYNASFFFIMYVRGNYNMLTLW